MSNAVTRRTGASSWRNAASMIRASDLGAGAEAPLRLVHDDGPAGLPRRRGDGLGVHRRDRQEVDHLDLGAVLGVHALGHLAAQVEHRAVGDQREVLALAGDARLADRPGLLGDRDLLLGRVIEGLRLEEDHGVGVADGAHQERARGARAGRDHDLEARGVRVELLLALRVMLERAHAAAVGHAHDHLARGSGPACARGSAPRGSRSGGSLEREARRTGSPAPA